MISPSEITFQYEAPVLQGKETAWVAVWYLSNVAAVTCFLMCELNFVL